MLPPPATTSDASTTPPPGTQASSLTSTSSATTSEGTSSEGSSSTTGAQTHEFVAAIALCTDPVMLDPDACEGATGPNHMRVDTQFTELGNEPATAWLRFDVDDTVVVTGSTTVTLQLVVGDTPDGDSNASGEVWEVEPFTAADLSNTQPATVGAVLGDDLGAVTFGETVQWSLPSTLIAPGESVYLGVLPVSNNGVDYWNANGDEPPRLIIEG